MKICLVTPDLTGLIKNGGIGTYATNLSKLLKNGGHDLTVVFTSTTKVKKPPEWILREHIRFVSLAGLPDIDKRRVYPFWDPFLQRSWRVFRWLEAEQFDLVHFQDWGANGFFSIQAKQTGLAFQNTVLTITLHAPTSWCQEGDRNWPEDTLEHWRRVCCERFCAENADYVLSPSQYMSDYTSQLGWKIKGESVVLWNPLFEAESIPETSDPDTSHIIFFGRLEERKGLVVFCQALSRYLHQNRGSCISKVSFVGKEVSVRGKPSVRFIKESLGSTNGLQLNFQTGLASIEAIDYIRRTRGLVLIPSLLDNFPYALIECIVDGIPVLSSNAGGMGEVCDPDKLFDPTIDGLHEVFQRLESPWKTSEHRYIPEIANAKILNWHGSLRISSDCLPKGVEEPRISVVIPCYNQGEYLEECLKAIRSNTRAPHEVLILNDGSSCEITNQKFQMLGDDDRFSGYRFFRNAINIGAGPARNALASRATGDWVLFCDADNIADSRMLEIFHQAIRHGHADIYCCHNEGFGQRTGQIKPGTGFADYRPLGDLPFLGLFENSLGDTNFCVRRSAFLEHGGFSPAFDCYEDWQFLLNVTLKGLRLHVIPKALYRYRRQPSSQTRRMNDYSSRMTAVETFLEHLEYPSRILVREILIPLYQENRRLKGYIEKMKRLLPKSLRRLLFAR